MEELFRLLGFDALMQKTEGDESVRIGLIDGPVDLSNPNFCTEHFSIPESDRDCDAAKSFACAHGTFIAGVLKAKRTSPVPGICPGCTLVSKPVFRENRQALQGAPVADETDIYEAILECIKAGTRIINMSLSQNIISPTSRSAILNEALDIAARSNVLIIAAAGNDAVMGNTVITKHPWPIAVSSCNHLGQPAHTSNFSLSGSVNGLLAPGQTIKSLGANNEFRTMSGTSAAAPFVTGAAALLWSEFRNKEAAHIRHALVKGAARLQRSIIPGLLNVPQSLNILKSI